MPLSSAVSSSRSNDTQLAVWGCRQHRPWRITYGTTATVVQDDCLGTPAALLMTHQRRERRPSCTGPRHTGPTRLQSCLYLHT